MSINTKVFGKSDVLSALGDSTQSDFHFEMMTVQNFVQAGFDTRHGGSYDDQITDKHRQFDVIARKQSTGRDLLVFAEAKQIAPNAALVVNTTPSTTDEAYHELLAHWTHKSLSSPSFRWRAMCQPDDELMTFRVGCPSSVYASGQPVGKSCVHVKSDKSGSPVADGDKEIYDRWAQALSSLWSQAGHLVSRAPSTWTAAVPMLVVPDGRLWVNKYAADGSFLELAQAEHVAYYLGADVTLRVQNPSRPTSAGSNLSFRVSHLEISTISACGRLANSLLEGAPSLYSGIPLTASSDPSAVSRGR